MVPPRSQSWGKPRQSVQAFKSELKALKKVSALLGEEYQKGMTITSLVHYRRKLARWLLFFMIGGLPLMIINIELRLSPSDDSELACELLRSTNVLFTLLSLLLLRQHNRVQCDLLKLCKVPLGSAHITYILHVLMLVAGVMPPGLEGTLPNPPLEDWLHSDCLGILMFNRFIVVLQLMTSMMPSSDPILLGQTHRIEVRDTFQLRYFLHQSPLRLLCSYLMVCWLVFAYMLHVFEHSVTDIQPNVFAKNFGDHYFAYVTVAWDLLAGLGWGPINVSAYYSKLVGIFLSGAGVLGVAMLTATFCSFSELDAAESSLITSLRRRTYKRQERHLAIKLMQHMFKEKLAKRRLRRLHANLSNSASSSNESRALTRLQGFFRRGASSVLKTRRGGPSWVTSLIEAAIARRRRQQEMHHDPRIEWTRRRFRKVHMILARTTDASKVANIKVLTGEVHRLSDSLKQLSLAQRKQQQDMLDAFNTLSQQLGCTPHVERMSSSLRDGSAPTSRDSSTKRSATPPLLSSMQESRSRASQDDGISELASFATRPCRAARSCAPIRPFPGSALTNNQVGSFRVRAPTCDDLEEEDSDTPLRFPVGDRMSIVSNPA